MQEDERKAERILQLEEEEFSSDSDWSAPTSASSCSRPMIISAEAEAQAAANLQAVARGRMPRQQMDNRQASRELGDAVEFVQQATSSVEKRGPVAVQRKSVFTKPKLLAKTRRHIEY